jgi:hypothetical protein
MTELKRYSLTRIKAIEYIEELAGSAGNNSISVYCPSTALPIDLEKQLIEVGTSPDISLAAGRSLAGSGTGIIFFRSDNKSCLLIPPFPVADNQVFGSIHTTGIRSLLTRDYLVALILVRLGSSAIGICRGEKLITSKVGTGLVHGRHRQGGSSAHRFERHRDKQIEYFMTRVCQHAREQIEPYIKLLDYIVYGGARMTVLTLRQQCDFLKRLDTPTLPPLLDIPDPRQPVLEAAVSRVWSSTVIELRED